MDEPYTRLKKLKGFLVRIAPTIAGIVAALVPAYYGGMLGAKAGAFVGVALGTATAGPIGGLIGLFVGVIVVGGLSYIASSFVTKKIVNKIARPENYQQITEKHTHTHTISEASSAESIQGITKILGQMQQQLTSLQAEVKELRRENQELKNALMQILQEKFQTLTGELRTTIQNAIKNFGFSYTEGIAGFAPSNSNGTSDQPPNPRASQTFWKTPLAEAPPPQNTSGNGAPSFAATPTDIGDNQS